MCNQGIHYEKYGRFLVTQRKPSHATTKLMLFTVSKDEWRTLISPEECIAHTVECQKPPLGLKQCQTVKKSSP